MFPFFFFRNVFPIEKGRPMQETWYPKSPRCCVYFLFELNGVSDCFFTLKKKIFFFRNNFILISCSLKCKISHFKLPTPYTYAYTFVMVLVLLLLQTIQISKRTRETVGKMESDGVGWEVGGRVGRMDGGSVFWWFDKRFHRRR